MYFERKKLSKVPKSTQKIPNTQKYGQKKLKDLSQDKEVSWWKIKLFSFFYLFIGAVRGSFLFF